MSTIQTRNKMDDKIHQNQFYFVANATAQNRMKYHRCQTWLSTFSYKSPDMLIK